MKPPGIFAIVALATTLSLQAATWDPRAPFESPENIVLQLAATDHAVICPTGYGKGNGAITVKDRAWIRAIVQQLRGTSFKKPDPLLCVSTNVAFCDNKGKVLHELQVFPGRARLDGIDYLVDAITATTLGELIRIEMENDSPGLAPAAAGPSR